MEKQNFELIINLFFNNLEKSIGYNLTLSQKNTLNTLKNHYIKTAKDNLCKCITADNLLLSLNNSKEKILKHIIEANNENS